MRHLYKEIFEELWKPETELDVFMQVNTEYEERVALILVSHGTIKCTGMNVGIECEICREVIKEPSFGCTTYSLGKSIEKDPLNKDIVFIEKGFDPDELDTSYEPIPGIPVKVSGNKQDVDNWISKYTRYKRQTYYHKSPESDILKRFISYHPNDLNVKYTDLTTS